MSTYVFHPNKLPSAPHYAILTHQLVDDSYGGDQDAVLYCFFERRDEWELEIARLQMKNRTTP